MAGKNADPINPAIELGDISVVNGQRGRGLNFAPARGGDQVDAGNDEEARRQRAVQASRSIAGLISCIPAVNFLQGGMNISCIRTFFRVCTGAAVNQLC